MSRAVNGGRRVLVVDDSEVTRAILVRTLRGSRWQVFTKIQLPGALPYIFSGMKVAAILAVAGAIVGEFLGSDRGLGYLMLQVQVTLDTERKLYLFPDTPESLTRFRKLQTGKLNSLRF